MRFDQHDEKKKKIAIIKKIAEQHFSINKAMVKSIGKKLITTNSKRRESASIKEKRKRSKKCPIQEFSYDPMETYCCENSENNHKLFFFTSGENHASLLKQYRYIVSFFFQKNGMDIECQVCSTTLLFSFYTMRISQTTEMAFLIFWLRN